MNKAVSRRTHEFCSSTIQILDKVSPGFCCCNLDFRRKGGPG